MLFVSFLGSQKGPKSPQINRKSLKNYVYFPVTFFGWFWHDFGRFGVIFGRFCCEKRLAKRSRLSRETCMKRDIDEHCEYAFHPTKRSVAAMFAKNQILRSNAQKLRKNIKKQLRDTDFQKNYVFYQNSRIFNLWIINSDPRTPPPCCPMGE